MRCTITTQSTEAQAETFLPLAIVKQGIRVRHTHEDAKIRRMRNDAVNRCEAYARIAILPKTVRVSFRGYRYCGDEFGVSQALLDPDRVKDGLKLPYPKAQSITSLQGVKADRSLEVIAADYYELEDGKRLRWKKPLPYFAEYVVVYATGYAGTDSIENDALKTAIIEVVQDSYDNPGEALDLPNSAKQTLKPFWNSPLTS